MKMLLTLSKSIMLQRVLLDQNLSRINLMLICKQTLCFLEQIKKLLPSNKDKKNPEEELNKEDLMEKRKRVLRINKRKVRKRVKKNSLMKRPGKPEIKRSLMVSTPNGKDRFSMSILYTLRV